MIPFCHVPIHRLFVIALFSLLLGGCLAPNKKPDLVASPVNMSFAFIRGGEFIMGSDAQSNSRPVHKAKVPDLFVGMYEVTFEQYDQFCEATGRAKPDDEDWGRDNHPAINVSWNEANAFAAWLSQATGETYRLPSETEWEYFARAGSTTQYWTGSTLPKGVENCGNCGDKRSTGTTPVGSLSPNPWKLFDILGNVQEWVLDDYQDNYNNIPTDGSPFLTSKATDKAVRGGAWVYDSDTFGTSIRDFNSPKAIDRTIGFRLVLEPSSKSAPGAK